MHSLSSLGALAILAAIAPGAALAAAPATIDAVHRADIRDLGRLDGRTQISLTFGLQYRNEAQLDRLIDQQTDPASPVYRHFLNNAQFDAAFAPATADYARVAASLARAGFTVRSNGSRSTLQAFAPAYVAERFFGTTFHRVAQAGVRDVRYVNVQSARIPASIADVVDDVVGLDSLRAATPDHVFLPRPLLTGPDAIGPPLKGPDGGYGPFAVAQGFDYPVQHGFDGTGHAVGIAIDYDTSDNDLAGFTNFFGITRTGAMHHVPVDGGQAYSPGGSVESTLDMETIASLNPGSDVYVYNFGASFTFQEISDAYNQTVTDNKVEVVSSSFGLCENDSPKNFNHLVNSITKQGAAKGITFVASTGDFGRGGKCQDGTGQDVPASLHFFTSVGGVDLAVDSNGKITDEHEDFGSGGGPSDIFRLPKYQTGLPGIFSTTKRNIPDVSGPYQPDSFYLAGRFQGPIGGTSWAAPATAAFLAQANQVRGKRLGWANRAWYRAFAQKGYAVYNDITVGNNGIACATGYDDCSGIGTLQGYALAQTL